MTTRIDTAAIRRGYPLADVVERYGIALRHCGAHLVGQCPFHADHEPSLVLYTDHALDEHFHCFGCGAHGDVIRFVELIERLPFRDAVVVLAGLPASGTAHRPDTSREPARRPPVVLNPEHRACLAVATTLYHQQLLRDRAALAYCAQRGLDHATIVRCQLGYATGANLAGALFRAGLDLAPAVRAGLLTATGRERLTGRLIVPEVRASWPHWLIGRALDARATPRYLGLFGHKPLLGWAEAQGQPAVCLTEGVIDRLVLSGWGLPALALAGTHATPAALAALARFPRLYLVLDNDATGRAATATLQAALGARARPVALPTGCKDVAELAERPGGRAVFVRALARASGDPTALAA